MQINISASKIIPVKKNKCTYVTNGKEEYDESGLF